MTNGESPMNEAPRYPAPLSEARRQAKLHKIALTLGYRALRRRQTKRQAPNGGDATERGEWFRRRLDELELFVECVSDDWQRGIVSELEAAAAIHRYLNGARFK